MHNKDEFDDLVAKYSGKDKPDFASNQYRDNQNEYKRVPPSGSQSAYEEDEDWDDQEGALSGLGRWTKALIALAVCLGLAFFLAFFALASASDLFGLNKEDKDITFQLPEGEHTLGEIADMLKARGVITQPLTFQVYAGLKYEADEMIPGEYALNSNMSYDQIIVKLRTGNRKYVEKTILFREGLTVQDIAKLLEENKICTAQNFYDFLDSDEMPWDMEFLKEVPASEARYRRFEGYLFPDTYNFVEGEDVATVVQKFFVNFNNKITQDIREKAQAQGMTVDQLLTLASIVQREAGNTEDMRLVASVFLNRLSNQETFPKLQSDVTVFYAEDELKPFLGGTVGEVAQNDPNQFIYDAYNTYVCDGLPAGPICNPGLDAINAVLDKTPSDYLYFVADADGITYYAKTLEEHNVNVQNALTKGEAHGVSTPK